MNTHRKETYLPPMVIVYRFLASEFCIGFGEGSIPPEDSDSNKGWFDEEPSDDGQLPKSCIRLWEE